ncbi:MAG: hypothetical protein GX020_04560 [Firmicutes bacterium]|nr:hypothetical protein [Bacillota bacterium]
MSIINHYEPDFERECIYVPKVYNECTITDCPIYRIPIPRTFPPAVNVVECEITQITTEGTVTAPGEVSATVNFVINIEYDSNGDTQFIQQTAQFRRRRIALEGALDGMEVVILPLIRCLNCRPVDGGTVIECDVGVYIVVKVVALVQLEVLGRFCPEPPECEDVLPIGCPEWFEMAESGAFWPPFPPQPNRVRR